MQKNRSRSEQTPQPLPPHAHLATDGLRRPTKPPPAAQNHSPRVAKALKKPFKVDSERCMTFGHLPGRLYIQTIAHGAIRAESIDSPSTHHCPKKRSHSKSNLSRAVSGANSPVKAPKRLVHPRYTPCVLTETRRRLGSCSGSSTASTRGAAHDAVVTAFACLFLPFPIAKSPPGPPDGLPTRGVADGVNSARTPGECPGSGRRSPCGGRQTTPPSMIETRFKFDTVS